MNLSQTLRAPNLLVLASLALWAGSALAEDDYVECPPVEQSQCNVTKHLSRAKACPKQGCASNYAVPNVELECFKQGQHIYCDAFPQSSENAYQYHWSGSGNLLFPSLQSADSPWLSARCNGQPAWISVTVIGPGGAQSTASTDIHCDSGPITIEP